MSGGKANALLFFGDLPRFRQIAGLGAFENLVHESGRAPPTLTQIRPVAHQPTIFDILAKPEHRR
jgi:hypothetical protein